MSGVSMILFRRKSSGMRSADASGEQTDSIVKKAVNLADLESGRRARVSRLQGNPALMGRLRAMGILPGSVIVKKSAIMAGGPIVVEKGSTQFAVGRDMAENIIVEPVKKKA